MVLTDFARPAAEASTSCSCAASLFYDLTIPMLLPLAIDSILFSLFALQRGLVDLCSSTFCILHISSIQPAWVGLDQIVEISALCK